MESLKDVAESYFPDTYKSLGVGVSYAETHHIRFIFVFV